MYDVIIVGAGFAGSVLAEKFASNNKKVLVIDKRNHIGGNMYEETRSNGVRVHKYGPHIFHTNDKEVFDYLQQFTGFYFYEHRVIGYIDKTFVPIPFNFKSLELLFPNDKVKEIKEKLLDKYSSKTKVSILDLLNDEDNVIKEFGKYVYEKVFVNYTAKQWNVPISEVDTSVINRVPVILGYDDRYFQDTYQAMPKNGFNEIFENMLDNKNIDIKLNTNAKDLLKVDTDNKKIYYDNKEFKGVVIYSGAIDEFLDYKYGPLPYRSLDLVFEDKKENYYQPTSVVNYTVSENFTRITEFKYLSNQIVKDNTTILKEYPLTYDYKNKEHVPYYAIFNDTNLDLYKKYYDSVKDIDNFYLCGRLAEYKYYNMDAVVRRALDLFKEIEGVK